MPTYTQANRQIAVTTPLGKDVLLLTGFQGHEAISQLFNFQLDLVAENGSEISFDRILGQEVTVEMRLAKEEKRYFNGIVKRFSQGARDEVFTHFHAELVPKFWLLAKKVRSRIFQHISVPSILHELFSELDVTYELSETYHPRDYCVQYRESDFDFASRLMEEEGIYYFFKHGDASHEMVVTDMASRHPSVSGQTNIIYEEISGGMRQDMRIMGWEKTQELRSDEYSLWDHSFELPGKNLEAQSKSIDSVAVGEVGHKLRVSGNDQLKIYDYPGGYAQRFSGIDRNGGAQPQVLRNVFPDSERTVRIRMEQEVVGSLQITGRSNCGHFVAGYKFTLERHFDANDRYLLTWVEHDAALDGGYRSSQASAFRYENRFTCIPVALPYRPQRVTHKPVIPGVQTATVVGPSGEKIFCDKYGRVKVQFHWDREGKKDADSSCWIRVSQPWGGKDWGGMFIPHVGQEVVVSFEEGDPDRPLITGRVYNPDQMPPLGLPANKTKSVIRDHGTNEIIMEGKGGEQYIQLKQAYGNEINMDAKSKTIQFYCPTHGTEMIMGKSLHWRTLSDWISNVTGNIHWRTLSDWISNVTGNRIEKTEGDNREVIVGLKNDMVGGARTEFTVGHKSENTAGHLHETTLGAKTTLQVAVEAEYNRSRRLNKRSQLQELMDEHKELTKRLSTKCDKIQENAIEKMEKYEKEKALLQHYNLDVKAKYEAKVNKMEQKFNSFKGKADKALMDWNEAQFICNTLKLC
jgi:type VI secretion system secreted protein VgrG